MILDDKQNLKLLITSGLWRNNILQPKDKYWSKLLSFEQGNLFTMTKASAGLPILK